MNLAIGLMSEQASYPAPMQVSNMPVSERRPKESIGAQEFPDLICSGAGVPVRKYINPNLHVVCCMWNIFESFRYCTQCCLKFNVCLKERLVSSASRTKLLAFPYDERHVANHHQNGHSEAFLSAEPSLGTVLLPDYSDYTSVTWDSCRVHPWDLMGLLQRGTCTVLFWNVQACPSLKVVAHAQEDFSAISYSDCEH